MSLHQQLKTRWAILHIAAGEVVGVTLLSPDQTHDDALRIVDALAPDKPGLVRNRVAFVTWCEP